MRLQEKYKKEIILQLKEELGYQNNLAVPKLQKVTVNVGVGRFAKDKAYIDNVINSLTKISGQKPVTTKARKSISSFKIREGMTIGVAVILRGNRMYDFIEKLIHITLPRVRDFRGLSEKIVDKNGNLSIGFKEHIAFPEISAEDLEKVHGLEVCITTTAKSKKEGLALFKQLGFPFKKV